MVVSNYPQIETANIDPDKHILWSVDYEDSYYNSSNPIGERQHVFINGLDLENRFKTLKDNQSFVMGETRFGAGLTFLLTAAIFLKNANKDSRLIWVSSELHPLKKNDDLFSKFNGELIKFKENEPYVPVFINEAAYMEKNIAMSLTKRELWDFEDNWKRSLIELVHQ